MCGCGTISTMHDLKQRLLTQIRKQELLHVGDRVAVAVSGGADSVALLLLLLELRSELGIVLSVAHVNHQLRGAESDGDESFVAKLAEVRGLEFHSRRAPVNPSGPAIENTARKLRYDFFRRLAAEKLATKIATGHTLDDQAETVLLRIFRGTGIRGLAAIHPRLLLEDGATRRCELVRPLLSARRKDLREFLQIEGQGWRDDSSNDNVAFLRNRVRHRLLPSIEDEFGEAAVEHLAELAEIARAEDEMWSTGPVPGSRFSVRSDRDRLQKNSESPLQAPAAGANLHVDRLLGLPLAAERRVVRAWLEANVSGVDLSFHLIEEVRKLARGAAGKKLELSRQSTDPSHSTNEDGARPKRRVSILRSRHGLELEPSSSLISDYEYALAVPGKVAVPEIGFSLEAIAVDVNSVPEQERKTLLDPARIAANLSIRNWRAGDRFWPAHTKQEKKVKELLADRHLSGVERKLWPVAVGPDGGLVWIRGLAAPAALQALSGTAIWIREISPSF
jgi:tRNA(Ile)-lysidine synthase